jgi:hypothetical protein
MAKKKDTRKSPAAATPDLEEELKRLRKENADLRKRLDKIAGLAEDLPGADDALGDDDEEDLEDDELLDDEDLEDVDEEEEEEQIAPLRS